MKFLGVAAVAAALTVAGLGSGVAQAESAPGCSSTVQIGSTAYITYGGETIASVKQFKGCNKNWAYTYVWDQFRSKHSDYVIASYIDGGSDPLGYTVSAKGARENWSYGTNTLSICTRADGWVWSQDTDYGAAQTGQRC
ncbi:hypothetical protein [Kutzneria buriramensis]|uniref:Peptidase inhibitor family I36 n=1 Tax=Kutzneria buriramensis TaxID=1045776 RepID=A0A3E0I5N9_9PSEU|nr:hypothetical protein [Kutzneria buriramensis]REH54053.1 hypothetical protein BCF44_102285 [Kutzneria buriramensis]